MSFKILTTTQFDASRYEPLGSVLLNRVETISLVRGFVGGIAGLFGGKNTVIQSAIDSLTSRAIQEFKEKVASSYPQTALVVGFDSMVTDVGRDEQNQYLIMHIKGTCLGPSGGAAAAPRRYQGGGKTRRAKSHRGTRGKGLRRGLAF